jgi:uncharacterized membrane protein
MRRSAEYRERKSLSRADRFLAGLCYLGPFLFLALGFRRRKFVKVHFDQAVPLLVTEVIIFLLVDICICYTDIRRSLMSNVPPLVVLLMLTVNIVAAIAAARGLLWRIPIIGWEREFLEELVLNKRIFNNSPKPQK